MMLLLAGCAIQKLEDTVRMRDVLLRFHASQIREGCYWARKGRSDLKEHIDRVAKSGVAKLAILEGKQQDGLGVPLRFKADLTALRQAIGDAASLE
jgi:hypothetical protein